MESRRDMDPGALTSQLMGIFLDELDEHVRVLNRELLALEREPAGGASRDRVATLLRTAHSLKGAARAVNLGIIEAACHRLEEILGAIREGERALEPALCALLLAAADGMEEASRHLRAGRNLDEGILARILPELESAAGAGATTLPSPPSPAGSRPSLRRDVTAATTSVRVAAERLDALLAHGGELIVASHRLEVRRGELAALRALVSRWDAAYRSRALPPGSMLAPQAATAVVRHSGMRAGVVDMLHRLDKDLQGLEAGLAQDGHVLGQAVTRLGDDLHRVRMLPFAEACAGLDRAARDLGRASGKTVDLFIEGGEVELDRSILEALKDPLLHLVRNAVDHGIEPPALRRAAAKSARGKITVAAALRRDRVEVVVADDGSGLDLDALRDQACKKGLSVPENEGELARVVFEPGLSTAPLVTDVSGRGLGLDVVKSRLETLNGTIEVSSTRGGGTRFTISVPLTLTTVRALLLVAAGQTFALACTSIERLAHVRSSDLRSVQGDRVLAIDGRVIRVLALAEVLGLPADRSPANDERLPVVIVSAGESRVAFAVDELLAEHDIVVKSLGARLRGLRTLAGGTLLASGAVALVLNAAHLVRVALGRAPAPLSAPEDGRAERAATRVLVVDDAITVRTLVKSILEAAGYDVTVAADGAIAWQLLQERGADVIVSDIEMPRMDGFALTETVRSSPRFRHVPVVLVTGRESEADKARGMRAGADAYLVKTAFDQTRLLETIAQLL